MKSLCFVFSVSLCLCGALWGDTIDRLRLGRIDAAVEAALKRGDCPGAVVLVVHRDEVVFRKAYGFASLEPDKKPLSADALFDLASITKPVATASSILLLIEQGKLRLSDKVTKYWPEFAANKKGNVTVEHCLLHISGLTADNALADYQDGKAKALERIAHLPLEADPGMRFRYSDVGFMVLGELVERVSGEPVDLFARKHFFEPLKMADTGFKPQGKLKERCAPTTQRDGKWLIGEVHDPRSALMGGVAGHAGLFGTAGDLARFARMLLHGGELDGTRVLSPLSVRLLTTPVAVPGGLRSRGWDVDTSYSAQRGELFPRGEGFGHTGFTGTSIWVDPPSQTAVIILTNRVHPNDKGNVIALRREVGTIVASALTDRALAMQGAPEVAAPPVLTGIDVLVKEKLARLKGRKIGLITNHTGRDRAGNPTIDLLHEAEGVKLVALFSPEHGIRGELDQPDIGDTKDAKTGLPVWSLYGKRRKPTAETLEGIDTLVYDIQDVGCRFYTYISTLGLVLESAAEHKLKVVVLDRPNPIGGVAVEGPVMDAGRESFVAYHSLPVRHGLTVGELAKMFNAERKFNADLEVIKVEGWRRANLFDGTNLTWVNPSPNMRSLPAALLYPGIGLLETTNLSVGRGTERPFEWIGAPWLDGQQVAAALSKQGLPGVRFVPVQHTPSASIHQGKVCGGVQIIVDDWSRFEPLRLGLTIALELRKLYPDDWQIERYDRLLVNKATWQAVRDLKPLPEIEQSWAEGLKQFRERRKAFLLYPE
jgi:uncharacterized protein YbbC (DUF1343 family)/CubicO group peptidase (beta-lactamase class C family)